MTTTEQPVERSVPRPAFTDAEAGAKEFPSSQSRKFTYYTPRKRRATLYEDVTVDVQPDPARYLRQGWLYSFADGVVGFPEEWTKLKSSNWHEFLDPNEEWELTMYRSGANIVRQIQQTIANAHLADAFNLWSRGWTDIVARHVGAWTHAEHGIGMHVYTAAQRDAPSNMINTAITVAAAHKLRFAQDLILYNQEISDDLAGFDGSAHKTAWQSDPVWQGVRENVEGLTGIRDWGEAFFATTIVFEPLVGELFRSHFVMQAAALQGDYVTPTVIGTGEGDVARDQRGARHLFQLLARDEKHGTANKAVMQEWLSRHTPLCVGAARQLQPIWSQLPEKLIRFEESFDRATARFTGLLSDLGLETPKELS
jgi:propane monooxygenase small subunit